MLHHTKYHVGSIGQRKSFLHRSSNHSYKVQYLLVEPELSTGRVQDNGMKRFGLQGYDVSGPVTNLRETSLPEVPRNFDELVVAALLYCKAWQPGSLDARTHRRRLRYRRPHTTTISILFLRSTSISCTLICDRRGRKQAWGSLLCIASLGLGLVSFSRAPAALVSDSRFFNITSRRADGQTGRQAARAGRKPLELQFPFSNPTTWVHK